MGDVLWTSRQYAQVKFCNYYADNGRSDTATHYMKMLTHTAMNAPEFTAER